MSTKTARPQSPPPHPDPSGSVAEGSSQTIGKYRIVRRVGVGGMAQVFLASREGPEGFSKPYVIKRILPELSRDEQFAKLFVIEAKVAALLDHPNIVHVFDFEIEDGNYYLVMEYVAGASLANILRANRGRGVPLGAQIAVELGAAVAHALAYAHELTLPDGKPLELVHRDISPGNVLVSRDGAVKLADFGVVKTSMTETVVGVVNGKWAYMSPEQITGQPVDQRSDLFSLGIVLYEVITGVRLFRAESAAATASRVLDALIRRPRTVIPDMDSALDAIVMKLLERNPEDRYQTASALATDLEHLRASAAFSGGAARLRGLVKDRFPDELSAPALGVSLTKSQPRSSLDDLNPVQTGPSRRDPEDDDEKRSVFVPDAASVRGAPRKLIVAITAACVIASVIFWLLVL